MVERQHVKRTDLGELGFPRIGVEGDAGDDVLVDFEDEELVDVFLDGLLGAVEQLLALHGGAGEVVDKADVALGGLADLLVIVAVDERADALVGKNFVEQAVEDAAVDDVDARGAVLDGLDGVLGFGAHGFGDVLGVGLEQFLQRRDSNLAADVAVDLEAGVRGEIDDFGRVERLGDFGREEVGVDSQGFAVGSEGDGCDDGHDLLRDEFAEEVLVDALDFAGELLVDAFDDPDRERADGVGENGFQRILREPLENEMGDARAGADGEIERGGVGDAGAVVAGDRDVAERGELLELVADAVDEDDFDAEAAEDRDVDEEVVEILVGDDRAVDGDDENLTLETRDVFEDAAQIVGFDRGGLGRSGSGGSAGRKGGAGAVTHGRWGDLRRSGGARQFTCRAQVREAVSPMSVIS